MIKRAQVKKPATETKLGKIKQSFPPGWDEERVRQVIAHYENQTEDEAVAEDEASLDATGQTLMTVPTELVPRVVRLIARHQKTA